MAFGDPEGPVHPEGDAGQEDQGDGDRKSSHDIGLLRVDDVGVCNRYAVQSEEWEKGSIL